MSIFENWKVQAKKLKRETLTLYFAYRHSGVPWYAKVLCACIVAYAFSPIDLIPDFIPVLGYLDDLVIVPFGVWLSVKMIPEAVLIECRKQAEAAMQKPTNWVAAAVIVLIWLVLLLFGIRIFIQLWRPHKAG
jgi:uncharacterized membrane protein YkvA (DUF1232 family)